MYKILRRQVYCDTLLVWFREMIWIFFVIKLFPYSYDFCNEAGWQKHFIGNTNVGTPG
jgi:hypothetical protein